MCKFINLEDLVANALIEMIEKNNTNKVSFEQLRKYGNMLISWFKNNNNEDVILLLSKHYISELIYNHPDYFEIYDNNETDNYIKLKQTKTAKDLRDRFRSYLSVDMLMAFTDKENLRELSILV